MRTMQITCLAANSNRQQHTSTFDRSLRTVRSAQTHDSLRILTHYAILRACAARRSRILNTENGRAIEHVMHICTCIGPALGCLDILQTHIELMCTQSIDRPTNRPNKRANERTNKKKYDTVLCAVRAMHCMHATKRTNERKKNNLRCRNYIVALSIHLYKQKAHGAIIITTCALVHTPHTLQQCIRCAYERRGVCGRLRTDCPAEALIFTLYFFFFFFCISCLPE